MPEISSSQSRRTFLTALGGCSALSSLASCTGASLAQEQAALLRTKDLRIKEMIITPIALPDPPILASSGCHGPYFLRNVVELRTVEGITGIGETHGGERVTAELEKAKQFVIGQSSFAYRRFAADVSDLGNSCYAGIELACLDAIGQATGRRLCELLGGPVRERVEFAAYLFYRYASDHPAALSDERLVDGRGRGSAALDSWGEVLTPEAMAEMAGKFRDKWGFRVFKLKGGVLDPEVELATMIALNERLGGKCPLRIDPNARWTLPTALSIGQRLRYLPLEYYEDPVAGQQAMAEVRLQTELTMSTNMCVTRFRHLPDAVKNRPIDVVLGDHHGWGGMTAFQTLGTLTTALRWGMGQHSNNHAGITMAAMIHAGAITPQLTYASDTHYVWLPPGTDILQGANLPIVDGSMAVPAGVGLGVQLDRDKLAAAHEVYRRSGMRSRDDGATMKRFQPGWKKSLF